MVATGGNLGARGSIGGSVLLQTILQPPAADSENVVSIDISLEQVCVCVKGGRGGGSSLHNVVLNTVSIPPVRGVVE